VRAHRYHPCARVSHCKKSQKINLMSSLQIDDVFGADVASCSASRRGLEFYKSIKNRRKRGGGAKATPSLTADDESFDSDDSLPKRRRGAPLRRIPSAASEMTSSGATARASSRASEASFAMQSVDLEAVGDVAETVSAQAVLHAGPRLKFMPNMWC